MRSSDRTGKWQVSHDQTSDPKLPVNTNCVQTPTVPVKEEAIGTVKRQLPSQTFEQQFLSSSTREAPLTGSIRLGAQLMFQIAVELEVTESSLPVETEFSRAIARATRTERSRPPKAPCI